MKLILVERHLTPRYYVYLKCFKRFQLNFKRVKIVMFVFNSFFFGGKILMFNSCNLLFFCYLHSYVALADCTVKGDAGDAICEEKLELNSKCTCVWVLAVLGRLGN
jgi:hypothetical protein